MPTFVQDLLRMTPEQKEPLDEAGHAEIPRALLHIQRGPGVVGILQGAPVYGEGGIAQGPALPGGIRKEEERGLQGEGEENLQADAGLRGAVEALQHGIRRGLLGEPGVIRAEELETEEAGPYKVQQHADG